MGLCGAVAGRVGILVAKALETSGPQFAACTADRTLRVLLGIIGCRNALVGEGNTGGASSHPSVLTS